MLDLLENKEKTKIFMLYHFYTCGRESMTAHDFLRTIPNFFSCEEVHLRSKNTYSNLMQEIHTEIDYYNLYEKIPIKLVAGELKINRNLPVKITYLTSIYLQKSVKYLLFCQAILNQDMTYRKFCDRVFEKRNLITKDNDYISFEENTIRYKIYQLTKDLSKLGIQYTTSFKLKGNEKNIRMYFYEIMLYHMIPLEEQISFIDPETKNFRDYCLGQTREIIKELTSFSRKFTMIEVRAFSVFVFICLYRAKINQTLDEVDTGIFNSVEELTASWKEVYKVVMFFYLREGLSEKVAHQEAMFCLTYFYTHNFNFLKGDSCLFSPAFQGKIEEKFHVVVQNFYAVFKKPMQKEMKEKIKEDFFQILARFLYFPISGTQKLSISSHFQENNPLTSKWAYLIVHHFIENHPEDITKKSKIYLKKLYFEETIYLLAFHMFQVKQKRKMLISNYLQEVNVCVQMFGGSKKEEYLKNLMYVRFYNQICFQEEPNDSTHIYVSNVLPLSLPENCFNFFWDQHISKEMLLSMQEKIREIQFLETGITKDEIWFEFD